MYSNCSHNENCPTSLSMVIDRDYNTVLKGSNMEMFSVIGCLLLLCMARFMGIQLITYYKKRKAHPQPGQDYTSQEVCLNNQPNSNTAD